MKLNILLLIFCFTLQLSNGQSIYDSLQTDLQLRLDQLVTEAEIPGITFSLLLDKEHQINLAAGYADKATKRKMLPDDRMLSGSVGKMFFSTVVLRLIQEGQLSLEDYASKHLGHFDWYASFPNHDQIKIINLLNHTSGLPRHLFQAEFMQDVIKDPLRPRTPEECIQSIVGKSAVHPVGKGWSYSDTNYLLLGFIAEKITGKKIYDIVKEDILNPLALDLTIPSTQRKLPGLVQGYVGNMNPFQLPAQMVNDEDLLQLHPAFEWTGGGYATNPQDLVKLAKFIHESDYLRPETKEQLTKPINMGTGMPYDNGYGLGTFIWNRKNDTRYGHQGFFPGYVSHLEYSKKRQYAISIQINHDGYSSLLQQFIFELEALIEKYLDRIDEEKILENFKTQEDCWNNADIECYMKAYSKTDTIQTISRGGITYGFEKISQNYKKYFPKDKMGQLHFDQMDMRRLSDDLYFVVGRFNLKFEGREELAQGWFSVTAKKVNGYWFLITDHSS